MAISIHVLVVSNSLMVNRYDLMVSSDTVIMYSGQEEFISG